MSESSLDNSSVDGKLLSTEVGSGIGNVLDESAELTVTNISKSKYGQSLAYPFYFQPQSQQLKQVNAVGKI